MKKGQLLQYFRVDARAGLRLLDNREFEVVEKNALQLLGRVEVNRFGEPGRFVDGGDRGADFRFERLLTAQKVGVRGAEALRFDRDSGKLHFGERFDERRFEVEREAFERGLGGDFFAQNRGGGERNQDGVGGAFG